MHIQKYLSKSCFKGLASHWAESQDIHTTIILQQENGVALGVAKQISGVASATPGPSSGHTPAYK